MLGFRLKGQRPPDPNPVKEGVVMRFDHVYEVDPERMKVFKQQDMPAWDTMRIVSNRLEHLNWMHSHFAESVISGEELEKELEKENKTRTKRRTARRKKK
jgi:uncharacterized damage-inducible protein DinB